MTLVTNAIDKYIPAITWDDMPGNPFAQNPIVTLAENLRNSPYAYFIHPHSIFPTPTDPLPDTILPLAKATATHMIIFTPQFLDAIRPPAPQRFPRTGPLAPSLETQESLRILYTGIMHLDGHLRDMHPAFDQVVYHHKANIARNATPKSQATPFFTSIWDDIRSNSLPHLPTATAQLIHIAKQESETRFLPKTPSTRDPFPDDLSTLSDLYFKYLTPTFAPNQLPSDATKDMVQPLSTYRMLAALIYKYVTDSLLDPESYLLQKAYTAPFTIPFHPYENRHGGMVQLEDLEPYI